MSLSSLTRSLLFLAGVGAAATTSSCNADNCARAVTGSMRQLTSTHFADCQSYFACTVTPAPSTVTTTTTVGSGVVLTTVTSGSYPENVARQIVSSGSAVTRCASSIPTYASACSGSVRYSSACSCYGATRSTSTLAPATVTITSTVTTPTATSAVPVPPTLPTLCGNAGLQWAYFYDSDPIPDVAAELAFDPTTHKTDTPGVTGVTTYLHVDSAEGNVYGTPLYGELDVVEHRGYIFAPESGDYTFAANNVDNVFYSWLGPAAYSGWTKDNAALAVFYQPSTNTGTGSFTRTLTAGTYTPFRVVYKNGYGPGHFDFTVTAPSGYVVVGSSATNAKSTPFLVQYSCDGTLAPQYPPFGQET